MKLFNIKYVLFLLIFSGILFASPNVSVTFVLDESGSVSSSNFQLENKGFINALEGLPIDGSVEISMIGFASASQTLLSRTVLTAENFDAVKATLEGNSQRRGGTNMSGAINSADQILNPSTAPTKVICLSTDGQPNSEASTRTAATNTKNNGVTLVPIGIGLNATSKTFLDSIASNPPVANPSNFTEFATVVRNSCVGVVNSALNIQLTPDPVDFGFFNSLTINEDIGICAKDPKIIKVLNKSNQPAKVISIEIVGDDANDFELISFMGVDIANLSYPITLSPSFSTEIKIKLKPNTNTIPADKSYDATLKLTAEDSNQISGEFITTLVAKVDPAFPSCLGVSQIDASPLVYSISDLGVPLKEDKSSVGEIDVAIALQKDTKQELHRDGLVADGNARLLLVSTTRQNTGKVRLEILNPSKTEARLYSLLSTPTYKTQSREYDDQGKTVIDLDIATDPDGFGQITAILRAGERFLGQDKANVKFKIKACILDTNNNCTEAKKEIKILEYKTPVILNHGLWAMPNSFGKIGPGIDKDTPSGLYEYLLKDKKYQVEFVQYSKEKKGYLNYKGPSELANSSSPFIFKKIEKIIQDFREKGIASTRADIIGHSMGGMMARSYILRHEKYKNFKNFEQGSVRRLVTLGTPHIGSGLGNLLWYDEDDIGNCIREEKAQLWDPPLERWKQDFNLTGYEVIDKLRWLMSKINKKVDTAIDDLRLGQGTFLSRADMTKSLGVPVFAVYGDTDDALLKDIGESVKDFKKLIPQSVCSDTTPTNECVSNALEYLIGCTTSDIFNGEDADGIVPLSSAMWIGYISGGSDGTYIQKVDGAPHTGMGTNSDIIPIAESLLNKTELNKFYLSN